MNSRTVVVATKAIYIYVPKENVLNIQVFYDNDLFEN